MEVERLALEQEIAGSRSAAKNAAVNDVCYGNFADQASDGLAQAINTAAQEPDIYSQSATESDREHLDTARVGDTTLEKPGSKKRMLWRARIEDWRRSGLKIASYCRKHALNYAQFMFWRRKFDSSAFTSDATASVHAQRPANAFIPIEIRRDPIEGPAQRSWACEIQTPAGMVVRLRVLEFSDLHELLRLERERASCGPSRL